VILGDALELGPSTQQARGALDRALRAGLFATPFGPGYYAGYTDRTGLLGVRDPQWREKEWEAALAKDAEVPPPVVVAPVLPTPVTKPAPTKPHPKANLSLRAWGGIGFGTIISPFAPSGFVGVDGANRVTSNGFAGAVVPKFPSRAPALRGFDLRWQIFSIDSEHKYPRWMGYFRSGYTAGYAEFTRIQAATTGQATSLSYFTVPLFVGGNFYPFANFPLRPYLGLGAGFDVLRVVYGRRGAGKLGDVSARIGFELHAGVEARITNYVSITAEIMQLWSARRKLAGVPDFSNEGFTIITGVAVAFPFRRDAKR